MNAKSPYTLAHKLLLKAQKRNGSNLPIQQVREQLESAPELVFPPGTTIEEVLKNLEGWELLKIEEGVGVRVLTKR